MEKSAVISMLNNILFEIAVKKGYCNIYSSTEYIQECRQRVVNEIFNGFFEKRKKNV